MSVSCHGQRSLSASLQRLQEPDERVRRPVATQIGVGHLESRKRPPFHREIGLYLAMSGCRALVPEPHSAITLDGTTDCNSAWPWRLRVACRNYILSRYRLLMGKMARTATGMIQKSQPVTKHLKWESRWQRECD